MIHSTQVTQISLGTACGLADSLDGSSVQADGLRASAVTSRAGHSTQGASWFGPILLPKHLSRELLPC